MVQLANLASRVSHPVPPEPILPAFHKLSRGDLEHIADTFLRAQEETVFKTFVAVVANRDIPDPEALGTLRGSFAREIRGLYNLRAEFEGPEKQDIPDDLPPSVPPEAGDAS